VQSTGQVESRLQFRKKALPDCGGRGIVTPIRREQLLKKLNAKQQV